MQRTYVEDFFEGMNEKLFFAFIILVQFLFIFQGLDFTESGFDADFYSRIFSDPSSVQYNFIYWLTGIFGGIWLKLFPGMGLIGLRIAGILFTTCTFWITYDLLKKYLHTGPLRISFFLIILFLTTTVKELNFYDLTAFFFICTVWFLFSGLTREKPFLIFIAGIFISLNTFSHLSNILGFSLLLAIFFYGYLNRNPTRQVLVQTLLCLTGFIFMSLVLLVIMGAIHHDGIFLNSLKMNARGLLNLKNPGNFLSFLKRYFFQFGQALAIAIVTIVVLWSCSAAWRRIKTDLPRSISFLPTLKYVLLILLGLFCILHTIADPGFGVYLFLFYAGISLITGFLIITGRQPKNLRILAAIGCLMLLGIPAASPMILISAGKYAVWIIVPITVDFLLNIRALSSRVVVSENVRHSYEQVIDVGHMAGLRQIIVYLTLFFILCVTYFYPYQDNADRLKLKYPVNNSHAQGIYTTEKRARVVNELLTQSALYVKPNDYVLAVDEIPMYYYLTGTRPYMHNSWVGLYDDDVFRDELYKSARETGIYPVVIIQKGSTIGTNWPENASRNYVLRANEMACLHDFLKTYQYNQVWENDFFKMYIPAVKTATFAEASSW